MESRNMIVLWFAFVSIFLILILKEVEYMGAIEMMTSFPWSFKKDNGDNQKY